MSSDNEDRPDKYITNSPGAGKSPDAKNGQRLLRTSPSWTPQPPPRLDLQTNDLKGAQANPEGGSQSVPDIGRYFTFYNKDDNRGDDDEDQSGLDTLDDQFTSTYHPNLEDTMTIAETESIAVVHRQASKKDIPSLPWWKEVLVIVAVFMVPILAYLTTYLMNHYSANIFELP